MKVCARLAGLAVFLTAATACGVPDDDAATCVESGGSCESRPDCSSMCKCAAGEAAACREQCSGVSGSAIELELGAAVNAARAHGAVCGVEAFAPAPPLARHPLLDAAARAHAADMAEHDLFSHDGADGATPLDRVRRAGFHGCAVGEDIARGQATAAEVVADWLASEGHCRTLLSQSFWFAGTGVAEDSPSGSYWVLDVGR